MREFEPLQALQGGGRARVRCDVGHPEGRPRALQQGRFLPRGRGYHGRRYLGPLPLLRLPREVGRVARFGRGGFSRGTLRRRHEVARFGIVAFGVGLYSPPARLGYISLLST